MEVSKDAMGIPSVPAILIFADQTTKALKLLRRLLSMLKDSVEETQTQFEPARGLLESMSTLEQRVTEIRRRLEQLEHLEETSISQGSDKSYAESNGKPNGGPHPRVDQCNLWPTLADLEGKMRACVIEIIRVIDELPRAPQSTPDSDQSESPQQQQQQIKGKVSPFITTLNNLTKQVTAQEQVLQQVDLDVLDSPSTKTMLDRTSRSQRKSGSFIASSPSSSSPGDLTTTSQEKLRTIGKKGKIHRQDRLWSCNALSGIDDAAELGRREDGALACAFCNKLFIQDDETAPHRLGVHLVCAHSYGLCNLNCTFSHRDELVSHLTEFHDWSRGADDRKRLKKILDRLFLLPYGAKTSKPPNQRLLALENGSLQPSRGMLLEERAESDLINLLVLNQILDVAGIAVDMSPLAFSSPGTPNPVPGRPQLPVGSSPSPGMDPADTVVAHNLAVSLTTLDRLLGQVINGEIAPDTLMTKSNRIQVKNGAVDKHVINCAGGGGFGTSSNDVNGAVANAGYKAADVGMLAYHAACVQQELAVTNGDSVLRHEHYYSAEQYRIDHLVAQHLPRSPYKPVWRRVSRRSSPDATIIRDGSNPEAAATAASDKQRAPAAPAARPPVPPTPSAPSGSNGPGPFRSYRDAVRHIGRLHMAHTGSKSYLESLPQLLRSVADTLRPERWLGPQSDGSVYKDGVPMPLTAATLAYFDNVLNEPSTSNTTTSNGKTGGGGLTGLTLEQKRLHWVAGPSLDWWFLGMLGASASFRRLVRSGKTFAAKSVVIDSDEEKGDGEDVSNNTNGNNVDAKSSAKSATTTRSRASSSASRNGEGKKAKIPKPTNQKRKSSKKKSKPPPCKAPSPPVLDPFAWAGKLLVGFEELPNSETPNSHASNEAEHSDAGAGAGLAAGHAKQANEPAAAGLGQDRPPATIPIRSPVPVTLQGKNSSGVLAAQFSDRDEVVDCEKKRKKRATAASDAVSVATAYSGSEEEGKGEEESRHDDNDVSAAPKPDLASASASAHGTAPQKQQSLPTKRVEDKGKKMKEEDDDDSFVKAGVKASMEQLRKDIEWARARAGAEAAAAGPGEQQDEDDEDDREDEGEWESSELDDDSE